MNTSKVAARLLSIVTQLRVFHWQTESFARHKAFGEAYDSLAGLSDTFVETMIGTYDRPVMLGTTPPEDLSAGSLIRFLSDTTAFLIGLTSELNPTKDSGLLNLRDEMLVTVNHLKYLLTLD